MEPMKFRRRGFFDFAFGVMSIVLLTSVFLLPGRSLASSSVNVPLDNWAYDALDRLSGFGLVKSDMKGTRPYTRLEVARLVLEAVERKEKAPEKPPELAAYLLDRFVKEYVDELADLGYGEGKRKKNFIKPLESATLRGVYVDGEPRRFVGFEHQNSRINGTEGTPLVYNNEGVIYGRHFNFTAQAATSVRVLDIFSGYVEPIFMARENKGGLASFDDDVRVDLQKGYLKIAPWNIELEAGRDSLWWGPGRHGSLLLTNNAEPLNLVKLSNPRPFELPWIFRYLGPFKYTAFLSRLEEHRDFAHAELGGLRLNFKPWENFEIGLSHTFIFGGRNGPSDRDFLEYLKILSFVEFGGGPNDNTNQLASVDFRWRMPFLNNAEAYLEWGGEDSGFKPHIKELIFQDLGYLVGLYFPRLTCDGRTDLRLEYADNVSERDFSYWYGHSIYTSGYTYRGRVLGHPMGPDARDVFARVTHYPRNDLLLGIDLNYVERGRNLGSVVEHNYRLGLDASYEITNNLSVGARYAYEHVDNFNLVANQDRNHNLFLLELKWYR